MPPCCKPVFFHIGSTSGISLMFLNELYLKRLLKRKMVKTKLNLSRGSFLMKRIQVEFFFNVWCIVIDYHIFYYTNGALYSVLTINSQNLAAFGTVIKRRIRCFSKIKFFYRGQNVMGPNNLEGRFRLLST